MQKYLFIILFLNNKFPESIEKYSAVNDKLSTCKSDIFGIYPRRDSLPCSFKYSDRIGFIISKIIS